MKIPEPQEQHRWLMRMLGEWTWESQVGDPGQLPQTITGTESVRALGGLWVMCEGESAFPGGDGFVKNVMTLGFDSAKNRFVGTFVSSGMTNLWIYEGQLGSPDRVELMSEGPNFSDDGGVATYRDSIEFHGPDERTLTSHVKNADGSWQEFMTARYRRVQIA
jgi:hypothetical protein